MKYNKYAFPKYVVFKKYEYAFPKYDLPKGKYAHTCFLHMFVAQTRGLK